MVPNPGDPQLLPTRAGMTRVLVDPAFASNTAIDWVCVCRSSSGGGTSGVVTVCASHMLHLSTPR